MMITTASITRLASARIPTDVGEFQLAAFSSNLDDKEHLAVLMGEVEAGENVLVRVHSECFTGDVLGSRRCDCGEQLQHAMERIAAEGRGIVLYLRQEGRGIGLIEKLRAYNLQDAGFDTVDANLALGHAADERDYTVAALMLRELGVRSIRLITNNPDKIESLTDLGIEVSERVPTIATQLTQDNLAYLRTKVDRMRHLLSFNGHFDAIDRRTPGNGHGHAAGAQEAGGSGQHPQPLSPIDFVRAAAGRRPLVTLSYAQTLDGAITSQRGRSTPISSPGSLRLTHQLRAIHDAILVGIDTVLSDDPRLNVRLDGRGEGEGVDPRPIVLDSRLRLPLEARLLHKEPRPIVATLADAPADKEAALTCAGAIVLRLPADDQGRVSLPPLLAELGRRGLHSVMIEGGAAVIQSFLAAGLANLAVITLSLRFMGGYHVLNGAQPAVKLLNPRHMQLDDDLILWGELANS